MIVGPCWYCKQKNFRSTVPFEGWQNLCTLQHHDHLVASNDFKDPGEIKCSCGGETVQIRRSLAIWSPRIAMLMRLMRSHNLSGTDSEPKKYSDFVKAWYNSITHTSPENALKNRGTKTHIRIHLYPCSSIVHLRFSPIWANYNNSLTWIKAIWGWFPLLTMISSELVVSSL